MADTYKIILLAEWDIVRLNVKKGLKRLGHDILIIPEGGFPKMEERTVRK